MPSEKKIARFLSCPVLLSASVRLKTSVNHMWHAYEQGLGQTSWKLWIGGAFRVSGLRRGYKMVQIQLNQEDRKGFTALSWLS